MAASFLVPRRVVVTGMGAITPLGNTLVQSWNRLLVGKGVGGGNDDDDDDDDDENKTVANTFSGETTLERALRWQNLPEEQLVRELEAAKALPCQVAAPVKSHELKHDNRTPRFVQMALQAGKEALKQAGLIDDDWKLIDTDSCIINPDRIGVCIGSGMSGVREIVEASRTVEERGIRRLTPHFVPKVLSNSAAGRLSLAANFRGPNHSVSTACAAGSHAIGDAMRFIQYNDADIIVAGGAEACIDPLSMAGFCRLKALSTTHEPGLASRPFDKDRDGFVMGEGSALLVLEELEHAKKRGATIYSEVCGYGLSGDAHHITAPDPEGSGAERAMRTALSQVVAQQQHQQQTGGGGVGSPESLLNQIGYVNAHATSTPKGDEIEARCIDRIFGGAFRSSSNVEDRCRRLAPLLVSSTKGATGHLLGAAGAIEAAFTVLALVNQIVPPTCNLRQLDDDDDNSESTLEGFNHVLENAQPVENMQYAMNNSFGFGGTNASVVFRKFKNDNY